MVEGVSALDIVSEVYVEKKNPKKSMGGVLFRVHEKAK
jgi:hypothetical protein